MRLAFVAAAAAVVGPSASVSAEPLPPGALGLIIGADSGTGEDAKRLGAGYRFGLQASWQPTTTERRLGWTLRWATMFGAMYGGSAATIDTIRTVQIDLTLGLRIRPWGSSTRFLTVRGGGELLRVNEPVPPTDQRAFLGGIASVGLDQYLAGWLLSVDVRYGLIGSNPRELALLIAFGPGGP
jgi:hypothetical protein